MNTTTTFIIFNIDNGSYGIDIKNIVSIENITEATKLPQMPEYMLGIVNIRGNVVPVLDISKLLYNKACKIDENTRFILVEINENIIALMAEKTNEIVNIDEEFINSVNEIGCKNNINFIKGVSLQENRIISMIDIEKLLASIEDIESIRFQVK